MSNTTTLIPGVLVGLKTKLTGNVVYKTTDLNPDESAPVGGTIKKWDTTKTVADAAEHDAAKVIRSKCRTLITGVCVGSEFLLCPSAKVAELDAAILEAYRLRDEFNATARLTRVGVVVIKGTIASDDEMAIRAINSEMAELLESMRDGAAGLDPAAIRAAANKANSLASMLTPAMQERVGAAIEVARKEARRIVKAGETAALTVDSSVVNALAHSRTAFLDVETTAPAEIVAPVSVASAIDLAPVEASYVAYVAQSAEIETVEAEALPMPATVAAPLDVEFSDVDDDDSELI